MVKEQLIELAHEARTLYWKIARPRTYGVKVALLDDADNLLMVRHAYGTQRWSLPGGGFKPKNEMPEQAALREISEELSGIEVPHLSHIGSEVSRREHKRDMVMFYSGHIAVHGDGPEVRSPELHDVAMIPLVEVGLSPDDFSWTVHSAVAMLREARRTRNETL